jgi:hypothetical protein
MSYEKKISVLSFQFSFSFLNAVCHVVELYLANTQSVSDRLVFNVRFAEISSKLDEDVDEGEDRDAS